ITSSVNSRERSGINTILHELNPLFTINVTMRDIKSKNVYSRVNSKATTQWRKTESANGVHLEGVASDNRSNPNFGRRVRNRRQLNSLQNTWPYGYSMPIAVRYTQDAFSRSGWLWPVDAKGEPLKATSYMAVGFYVAKYVNKK